MTKTLLSVAAAALFAVPQVAAAQALPAPVIAVVDVQRAMSQCNACKNAEVSLKSQLTGLQNFEKSLAASLKAEQTSIQTAVNALSGKQPEAALVARYQAFEKKQGDAQRQLLARQQGFERNRAYVLQQIGAKLDPAMTSVLARRGANVILDAASTVRFTPALDVTNDVLAALNASLPSITTTAPAAAAQTTPRR